LKRAEMDLIKQKKQVQRSLKAYEASKMLHECHTHSLMPHPLIDATHLIGEFSVSQVQWWACYPHPASSIPH
jgi:hypothetical protein